MPVVPAICPNCGANLEVNKDYEAAKCPYCGTAYLVEDAINNYNTTNIITNHIQADTVNVYGGKESDFDIQAGTLVGYKGESADVVIPNNVRIIGYRAFKDMTISRITIPGSVKQIQGYAFERCWDLKEVVFLDSIPEMPVNIFEGLKDVKVVYPKSCEFQGRRAYTNITSFTIPDGIKSIEADFFNSCKELESVHVPETVEIIGDRAFADCEKLKEINFPNSLKRIGAGAFLNCKSLKVLEIPESVQSVGTGAVEGCDFDMLSIPSSIEDLHEMMFKHYVDDDGCEREIGVEFSAECIMINTYNIGRNMFDNLRAKKVKKVIIGEKVQYIDSYAFHYCPIEELTFLGNDTQCHEYAFYDSGKTIGMHAYRWEKLTASDECKKKNYYCFKRHYKLPLKYRPAGCYIATCVYGSYDCPEVWVLRRYRDQHLQKSVMGRAFIAAYYTISPTLVEIFGNTNVFHKIWKPFLDRWVKSLHEKGYQDTQYYD